MESLPKLSLDLPDRMITQNLHNRIQNSIDYWNDTTTFNLRNKRIKNLRMIRGDQLNEHQLYHYQTPWKDNELYVGVDAMIAYATAAIAQVECYPESKKPESRVLAGDTQTYMRAYDQKMDVYKVIEDVVYNLLAQYIGVEKYEWDPFYGKHGEIIRRSVNPTNLILDKNTRRGRNPVFVCEVLKDSVEGLIAKFPEKKDEIWKLYGIRQKGALNQSKEVAYREVWFTYYDKEYKQQEAVCWYLQNLVLDKRKDPNWLYKGEGENFLDNHTKPYVFYNLFNDGEHLVDITSSVEQAVPMQDILNKEGRQILDNLATANGFRLVLAGAMTDDALENLTGDPNQSVVVKAKPGQTLDDVYKQIQPHLVSAELIADKQDSRDTIHGILGTPSQFRGDDTDQTKTASEAILIKNQASGRQDKLVRALNTGLSASYRMFMQMMTVWYTEKHKITADGGDGNFDFVEMHNSKIRPGMTVRVYAEPSADKARQEAKAQNAAEIQLIAPIDYYKDMHMDNPQKRFDNLVKWKTNPQTLAMDLSNDNEDRDAIVDYDMLMAGQAVDQRDDITPEYLDQFRKCMLSDEFLGAERSLQTKVEKFVQAAMKNLAQRTLLESVSNTPPAPEPLPPEVQATLPPPQMPGMPGAMPGMQPQGMPPAMPGAMQPPQPPMMPGQQMPASPPMMPPGNPATRSINAPLPALGIQGALQTANQPPNLNPQAQPQGVPDINNLTAR